MSTQAQQYQRYCSGAAVVQRSWAVWVRHHCADAIATCLHSKGTFGSSQLTHALVQAIESPIDDAGR